MWSTALRGLWVFTSLESVGFAAFLQISTSSSGHVLQEIATKFVQIKGFDKLFVHEVQESPLMLLD